MKLTIIFFLVLLFILALSAQQSANTSKSTGQKKTDDITVYSTGSPRYENNDKKNRKQPDSSKVNDRSKPFLSLGSTACAPGRDVECRMQEKSVNQEDQP